MQMQYNERQSSTACCWHYWPGDGRRGKCCQHSTAITCWSH